MAYSPRAAPELDATDQQNDATRRDVSGRRPIRRGPETILEPAISASVREKFPAEKELGRRDYTCGRQVENYKMNTSKDCIVISLI